MLVLGYFFQIVEGEKNVTEEQYFLSFFLPYVVTWKVK